MAYWLFWTSFSFKYFYKPLEFEYRKEGVRSVAERRGEGEFSEEVACTQGRPWA